MNSSDNSMVSKGNAGLFLCLLLHFQWGNSQLGLRSERKKLHKAIRQVTLYFSRHNVYKTPGAHMHTHPPPQTQPYTYQVFD